MEGCACKNGEHVEFVLWVRMSLGEMNLTINWLACKTGYARETISRVLSRKVKPSREFKEKLISVINEERKKRMLENE